MLKLTHLIPKSELEKVLDKFTSATGVGCIITDIYGNPITRSSNWCKVCSEYHRQSKLGGLKCRKSDRMLGEEAYRTKRPAINICGNGAFLDAVVPIVVNDQHIANVAAGQVLYETPNVEEYIKIAIDMNITDIDGYVKALKEVKIMSQDEFKKVIETLDYIANMISNMAFQKFQIKKHQEELEKINDDLLTASKEVTGLIRTIGNNELNKRIASYYNYKLEDIKLTTKTLDLLIKHFAQTEKELKTLISDLINPVIEVVDNILVVPIVTKINSDKEVNITKVIVNKINISSTIKVCVIDVTGLSNIDLTSLNHIKKIMTNIKAMSGVIPILAGTNPSNLSIEFKIKNTLTEALQCAQEIAGTCVKTYYF